jgi:hypothetical protein
MACLCFDEVSADGSPGLLHEKVRGAAKRVVRVLNHPSGRSLLRIDHVLRIIKLVGLNVLRHTVLVSASATTPSAACLRTMLPIVTLRAPIGVNRIRLIGLGIISVRGIKSPLVTCVRTVDPCRGLEIMMVMPAHVW